VYGFHMVNAVGFAIWPTPHTLGWPFIVLATPGIAWAAFDRRARSAALVLGAIALQGAALVVTGRSTGATAPYLSLKMAYLAIYPLSVAAAVMIARAWRAPLRPAALSRYAWIPVVIVSLAAAGSLASAPPVTPVITEPVWLAGDWRARISSRHASTISSRTATPATGCTWPCSATRARRDGR